MPNAGILRVALWAAVWSGCAPGSGCGGDEAPTDPFPSDRMLERSARLRITSAGAQFLGPRLADVLRNFLGTDEQGFVKVDLEALAVDQIDVIDLGIIAVGFRDLVLGIDLDDLEIEPDSPPDRIVLRVTRARVAIREGILAFTALGDTADAACRLTDGIDPSTPDARTATLSFEIAVSLSVDADRRLQGFAEVPYMEVHELGLRFPLDCEVEECTDGCTECEIGCPILDDSQELIDDLVGGIEEALADAMRGTVESMLETILAQLGEEPLQADVLLDAGNIAGGRVSSLRAANPLRLALGPSPSGFDAPRDTGGHGLDVVFDVGLDAEPHPCIPPPGPDPIHRAGAGPDVPTVDRDGQPVHAAISLAESILDEGLWAAYKSGILCASVTSEELVSLSDGSVAVTASAMEALMPGLAAVVGPEAPILVQLEPRLSAEDFPLVRFEPGPLDRPVLTLGLADLGISVYALIDHRHTRVLGISLDARATGGIVARPDSSLELVLDGVEVGDIRITYDELFPGGRLDQMAEFLSGVVASGLLGEGITLPLDTATALSGVLGIPISLEVRGLTRGGVVGDWVTALLVFRDGRDARAVRQARTRVLSPATVALGVAPTLEVPPEGSGGPLEYQVRRDHLPWTSFSPRGLPDLSGPEWLIPGDHVLRVRARDLGEPLTLDVKGWRGIVRVLPPGEPRPAQPKALPDAAAPDEGAEGGGCAQGRARLSPLASLAAGLLRRAPVPAWLGPFGPSCSSDEERSSSCASTSECPAGEACARGVCLPAPPCGGPEDCCPGQICLGGLCQDPDACTADAECTGVAGTCVNDWCVRRACEVDGACPPAMRCVGELCVRGLPCDGACGPGDACHAPTASCRPAPRTCDGMTCAPGKILHVRDPDSSLLGASCGWDDVACECVASPALEAGAVGRWGSVAVREGKAVAAAYDATYGDLVWIEHGGDGTPERLESIDGLPGSGAVVGSPDGYRGGVTDPGPDVGRFASLALAADGSPIVAYRSDDQKALRLTTRRDGAWRGHVVDNEGDAGWNAALALHPDGRPAVAYVAVDSGDDGHPELRYIAATRGTPRGAGDWARSVLARRPAPAAVVLPCGGPCQAIEACLEPAGGGASECLVPDPVETCGGACASNRRCHRGTCMRVRTPLPEILRVPRAPGFGLDMAISGARVAVAWADRTDGTVRLSWSDDGGAGFRELVVGGGPEELPLGPSVAVAVAPDGRLLVAWEDRARSHVVVATGAGPDALAREVAHDGPRSGLRTALGAYVSAIFTEQGRAYLAYQDPRLNDLWVAERSVEGRWQPALLLEDGAVGYHADLAEDSGRLHVYSAQMGFDPAGRSLAGTRVVTVGP